MSERGQIIAFPGRPGDPPALQFRVELMLVPGPVWRRIVLPGRCSFWDLHVAIQDAMGWEDRHLHLFTLDDPDRGEHLRVGIPDDNSFHGLADILAGWEYPVTRLAAPGGSAFLYTYDFAAEWQHEVLLEGEVPGWSAASLPACSEGEGACPPEDCGGPDAFVDQPPTPGAAPFDPTGVVFDNPRERWHRSFGHD